MALSGPGSKVPTTIPRSRARGRSSASATAHASWASTASATSVARIIECIAVGRRLGEPESFLAFPVHRCERLDSDRGEERGHEHAAHPDGDREYPRGPRLRCEVAV